MLTGLISGAKIVILPKFEPKLFLDTLQNYAVSGLLGDRPFRNDPPGTYLKSQDWSLGRTSTSTCIYAYLIII